jgi:hypothetical protein
MHHLKMETCSEEPRVKEDYSQPCKPHGIFPIGSFFYVDSLILLLLLLMIIVKVLPLCFLSLYFENR